MKTKDKIKAEAPKQDLTEVSKEALADQMAKKLEQDRIKCNEEIALICNKYNCELRGVPFISNDGRISANVGIVNKIPSAPSSAP